MAQQAANWRLQIIDGDGRRGATRYCTTGDNAKSWARVYLWNYSKGRAEVFDPTGRLWATATRTPSTNRLRWQYEPQQEPTP